jgi:hypothetical protein
LLVFSGYAQLRIAREDQLNDLSGAWDREAQGKLRLHQDPVLAPSASTSEVLRRGRTFDYEIDRAARHHNLPPHPTYCNQRKDPTHPSRTHALRLVQLRSIGEVPHTRRNKIHASAQLSNLTGSLVISVTHQVAKSLLNDEADENMRS